MRTQLDLIPGEVRPDTLLVLLPPAKATLDDLLEQGFVADIRARGIQVDVLLAEVTYEQVMAKTVAASLHEGAIVPALAQGYRHIWLAGISIGAFNALHYAAIHGGSIAGLELIAPYGGTSDILSEIETAGGPAAWAALPGRSNADERVWWQWLCQVSGTAEAAKPIYVGLASEDRFLRGQRLLAGLVPAEHVDEIDGDHSWPVWRALWQRWLDRRVFTTSIAESRGEA
jgi:pimeloyl-ACP methyl ester carboxylesterase